MDYYIAILYKYQDIIIKLGVFFLIGFCIAVFNDYLVEKVEKSLILSSKVYKFFYRETAPIIAIGWTIGIIYYIVHL